MQLDEISYTQLMPPTYFKTNSFTYPFHEIVNTYGIPSYKEINPAFYACITFPFLFGVMFGDIGHGSLLLFISILLCTFGPCLRNFEWVDGLMPYRYLLLLMGFFATYCGFIYNDFVSLPLNLGKSCYDITKNNSTKNHTATYNVVTVPECVY